ncbi:hypothetical protein [Streptomyces violens]|uniref:hypothetical protein n=1 Tax=Streptomyces violens TaxID=66377 RepID=UPI0004C052B6|nr:hypothetical protein [Streptomyces violens]
MKSVFPYPTVFGDIDFEVASVTVDGAPLPYAQVSTTERTVALHRAGREHWDRATLRLKARLPEPELAEGPWTDITCVAVLTEKATNARTTTKLTRTPDGDWHGAIDLFKHHHLRRATVTVNVVGTVDGIAGRLIGSPEQVWYVDLRESTPARRREIEIVEVDFRDGPHDWLRPFQESPWIVETSADTPTVYLNTTAVEGLMEVLCVKGGSAAERVLRDMTAGQIAQDTWTAMFHTAISDLDVDEDGTPVMPTGWREAVVRMMLPDVLPGRQLTDALYDINERRTQGFGWSQLQTAIQYAAGRRSRISKKLTSAVRTVDRAEKSVS